MRDQVFFSRIIMAAVLAVLLAGCGNEEANAPVAVAPEVGVIRVSTRPVVFTTELPGRTSPFLVAEVRPQVGGIIQKRIFKEGSVVKAGDILYQIDPETFKAQVDSAEAALKKAEANLLPARLKAERYADLVKVNAVSQQECEDALAASQQARAEVGVCRAAVKTARIDLNYTSVRSPITGHIGKSAVTDGALVTANQAAPLATVQQLEPMYVDVTQSSTDLARLRRNLESGKLTRVDDSHIGVKLLLEDGTPYNYEGKLQFTDVTVDQSTGAVTLRAIFPNPDQELLPGMYVRAVISEGKDDSVILVPQSGVMRDATGNAKIFVVGADNIVEERSVKTGRVIEDSWQITEGLKHGERVVLEGLLRVRNGVKVTPVDLAEESAGQSASTRTAQ